MNNGKWKMIRNEEGLVMAGGAFDKDFGYLMPFLDKVTAAAGEIADPGAREELLRLTSGEKQRWTRIRELLGGGASPAQPASQARPATSSPTSDAPVSHPASAEERPAPAFTVGSLRHRS